MAKNTSAQYLGGIVAGSISTSTPASANIFRVSSAIFRFTSHSHFPPPDDPVLPSSRCNSSGTSSFFQCPACSPTLAGPSGRFHSLIQTYGSLGGSRSASAYGGAPEPLLSANA